MLIRAMGMGKENGKARAQVPRGREGNGKGKGKELGKIQTLMNSSRCWVNSKFPLLPLVNEAA